MNGLWTAQNEFIGIGAQVGHDALIEMHERLYRGPLEEFLRSEFEYEPHITLGRAIETNQFEAYCAAAAPVVRQSFRDLLRALSIVRFEPNGALLREREVFLQCY